MKNYLACLVILFGAVVAVHAAPPSDQSIEQMMNVMHVEKMLDQMMTQMEAGMRTGMEQSMQQSLHGNPPTDAQKAQAAEFQKKFMGIMKDELSYAKMKDI